MYYEILVNNISLGVFGHESVRNMHLSVSVSDNVPEIFASAVCEEDGELHLYDWLQHAVTLEDKIEIRHVLKGIPPVPRLKRKMSKSKPHQGTSDDLDETRDRAGE